MNSRVFMFMFLLLLQETEPHGAAAMIHSLKYFHTFSSQVPNFPEFVSVGYVDGLQITHYDSNTKKYVPKQEWMNKLTEEDPKYWEKNTRISLINHHTLKFTMETAKQRLSVTEGLHLWQNMYGCEWDDETNEIKGYDQYAFDGEDFISFDFQTGTFVAPKQEAFITKQKWERIGYGAHQKNYIIRDCAEYLKKHVHNGEHVLKRTERPLVSLLQKSSSAPVTCHATGFYPDRALLFWTKDGDELMEDAHPEYVEPEEILPNGDGTFQTSVSLDLSSVPPEDWDRYRCVFQWSGVKENYVTRLDRTKIMTNEESHTDLISAVLAALAVLVLAVVAFVLFRRFQESPTALISAWVLLVAVVFVLAAIAFFSFRGFQEESHTVLIPAALAALAALAVLVLAVVAFVSFRRFQEKSPTALIAALVLLVAVVLVLAAIAFFSFRGFQEESHTDLIFAVLAALAVLVLAVVLITVAFVLFRGFQESPTALISAWVLLVAVVFVLAAIAFFSFRGFQEESHTALISAALAALAVPAVVVLAVVLCAFIFISFRRSKGAKRSTPPPHEMVELNPE